MKKIFAILGIVMFVFMIHLFLRAPFNSFELSSYDARSKMAVDRGLLGILFKHADSDIMMVSIDDASRAILSKHKGLKLGAWPWRRDVWGDVVDYIEQGKPRAILFDIIFTDIDTNSSRDEHFASVLKKYDNVVLATSLNNPQSLVDRFNVKNIPNSDFEPTQKSLDVEIYDKDIDYNWTYRSHSAVHDMYTKYSTMGVVNKIVNYDNVIRHTQPIFKVVKDGKTYYMPSLSFAGFLKAVGEGDKIVVKNHYISYKNYKIPLDMNGQVLVSWHGLGKDYQSLPISLVLLKQIDPKYFEDKIIIIGRVEAGTDIHPSAVNKLYAGPEVNATLIDNYMNDSKIGSIHSRKFLRQTSLWFDIIITLLFCVMIAYIALTSENAVMGLLNGIFAIVLYLLISLYTFVNPSIRLWMPVITPLYYLLSTAALVFTLRLQDERAKKSQLMNVFGKFVSPTVLHTVLKEKKELTLENSKKHVTIMFCDVKNFTSLSETSNPQKLVDNLNEMFDILVNIIFKNNGTVDKFVGDCIMAYWGDPISSEDDALMAVRTAFEIKEALQKWRNENPDKLQIDVKMGINTGDAFLGLVGSRVLMSYTAMGDAVNTASRLESSCNKYHRDILISKNTFDELYGKVDSELIGEIEVKGKAIPIEIYCPIRMK